MIAGEVRRVSVRPTRRRLTDLKAAVADASGEISAVWFNQPWLADKLQPGRGPAARAAAAQRVPCPLLRPRTGRGDRGLRAGLPGQRGGHVEEAADARRGGAAVRARRSAIRCRPRCGRDERLPLRRDALARAAPTALARGGRARPAAARVRRAARCSRSGSRAARASAEASVAPALGRPGELVGALPRSCCRSG